MLQRSGGLQAELDVRLKSLIGIKALLEEAPAVTTQEAKWSLSFNTLSLEISGHVRPCALT